MPTVSFKRALAKEISTLTLRKKSGCNYRWKVRVSPTMQLAPWTNGSRADTLLSPLLPCFVLDGAETNTFAQPVLTEKAILNRNPLA